MTKLDKEMFDYFNEWLIIWNRKYLKPFGEWGYVPTGDEPNYEIAKQINDFLVEQLNDDIPF